MRKYIFLVVIVSLSFLSTGFAQDSIKVDFSIRQRFELDDKSFQSAQRAESMNLLRSRLGVNFIASENVSAYAQIQDSRFFGGVTSTLSNSANVDLHQAIIVVKNFFGFPAVMKLGRQEVSFGNQRLIGAVDWSNVGRSFDGVRFTSDQTFGTIDLFNFNVRERYADGDVGDKNFMGVWTNLNKINKGIKPQGYLLMDNIIGPGSTKVITIGTQTDAKFGDIDATGELAFQTGSVNDSVGIGAIMFAINALYNINSKTSLSGGLDFLSGDDDFTDDSYSVFNTLYATNHKFYGFMDYLPAGVLGLVDIHVKANHKQSEKLNLLTAFHILNSAKEAGGESSYGNELDIVVNYNYGDGLGFSGGLGYFFPGGLNVDDENGFWGFVQTSFALQ